MNNLETKAVKDLNRRGFLTGTLAATAASWVTPSAVLGAETPAPSGALRKVKLGVVGNGGRGARVAKLFQKHGGFELHAVADYFQQAADQCGDALGVDASRRYSGLSGFRRLMESGVEAVALETPPYFFPEHASAAVEAGLHVYIAKPVAVDVPGSLTIEAAGQKATARQRVFLVDYQLPTDPHNQEIVKQIHEDAIGRVFMLNSHYYANNWPDPPLTDTIESRLTRLTWCNDIALGGGHHVNACIHAIDAALWVAGKRPVSALGVSRTVRPDPHGDSADVFAITFQFEGGLILTHRGKHMKNFSGFEAVCEIQGQTGSGMLAYGGVVSLKGPEYVHRGEVESLYDAGITRNIALFHKNITEGQFDNPTVRRAVDGVLTTILGREAGRRQTPLSMAQLLKENQRLELDLKGLKA